jgi:hypothetical protein
LASLVNPTAIERELSFSSNTKGFAQGSAETVATALTVEVVLEVSVVVDCSVETSVMVRVVIWVATRVVVRTEDWVFVVRTVEVMVEVRTGAVFVIVVVALPQREVEVKKQAERALVDGWGLYIKNGGRTAVLGELMSLFQSGLCDTCCRLVLHGGCAGFGTVRRM